MSNPRARIHPTALAALVVALSACAAPSSNGQTPRVELPQQLRLQQNPIATALERRSGRIAVVDAAGNVVVVDQTGGDARAITTDANLRSVSRAAATPAPTARQGPNLVRYSAPIWSPDATRLAVAQVTLKPPESTAVVAEDVESIVIRPGANGSVSAVDARGRYREISTPSEGLVISQPGQIYVMPRSADTEARVVASALYVAAANGQSPLVEIAAARNASFPYYDWSPDGSRLAVLSRAEADVVTGTLSLARPDGGDTRVVYRGADAFWDWNHDGSALLSHGLDTGASGEEGIALVSAASGQVKVAGGPEDYPFFTPQFSPDGSQSLIATREDGQGWLTLADANGAPVRKLVSLEGLVAFSWSPAGGQVAYTTFASRRGDGPQAGGLRLINVATGEERILSEKPVVALFWSPDGSRIAAFGPGDDVDAETFPGIAAVTENTTAPLILNVIDVRTGAARALLLFEPTSQFAQVLARFDRFSRSMTLWSPDSLRLVVPVSINRGSEGTVGVILEMEATGSVSPRVLSIGGTMAVWSPR